MDVPCSEFPNMVNPFWWLTFVFVCVDWLCDIIQFIRCCEILGTRVDQLAFGLVFLAGRRCQRLEGIGLVTTQEFLSRAGSHQFLLYERS